MRYECDGCGESFDTLSRKRLHDCPEGARFGGDAPDLDLDLSGENTDALAGRVVSALLECDVCGKRSEGASDLDRSMSEKGAAIAVTFDCDFCGAHNENSAVLE